MKNKKGVLYTEKISNLSSELDDACFTSYNWWKQAKECVKPLLNSLGANIEVSLSMRQEQMGRGKSKFRFIPINEETCLVLTHTKQAEDSVNGKWNTIYCYKVDWVSIMARLANNGYRAPYLVNMLVQNIFKQVGREKNPNYLGRWFSDMDNVNGVHVIKHLPIVVGIPLGRKECKNFVFPMNRESLLQIRRSNKKVSDILNVYHNYSSFIWEATKKDAIKSIDWLWRCIDLLVNSSVIKEERGEKL